MAIIVRAYELADVQAAIKIWNGRFKSGGTVVAPQLVNDSNVVTAFIRNAAAT